MAQWLKQSTACTIMFGPFVDKADGITLKTDSTTITDIDHASTGIFLSKAGAAAAVRHATVTASVADAYGMMKVTLDTTDTGTLGTLDVLFAKAATYLPVFARFEVLPATMFDSLVTGSGGSIPGVVAGAAGGLFIAGTNAATTITTALTTTFTGNLTGTTGDAPPTAATVAAAVWDLDATAHQTAGTFGKAIGDPLTATNSLIQRTPDAVAGAANGLFIAGTNAATTVTTALTTTFTGNLTGSVASVSGAVGSVSGLTAATVHSDLDDIQARLPAALSAGGNIKADVLSLGGVVQSLTDLKDFADTGYDPSTHKVAGVVLTDTVTTYTGNTKQTADVATLITTVGAAGAGLTALATQTSVNDLPTNAELATALGTADDAVLAAIGALNDFDPATDAVAHVTLVDTVTTYTGNTKQTADVATLITTVGVAGAGLTAVGLSVTAIQAIWDALTSALTTVGSIGKLIVDKLSGLAVAADIADAVLDEATSGHTTGGTVGKAIADAATAPGLVTTLTSKLLKYVQLMIRKDAGIATDNATELTAINADGGSGAGGFANTTDSHEAIRDNTDKGLVSGVVGSASTTTSIVTSSLDPAAAVTDQFRGRVIIFDKSTTTANLRGQADVISASTAGGVLTVSGLTTAPVNGDSFRIF